MHTKGFFQFEIIINVLASSFWFIWIGLLMLWAHGHCKIVKSFSAGIDFRIWRLQPSDYNV